MIIAFEHVQNARSWRGKLIERVEKYPYVHVELLFNHQDWLCFSARSSTGGVSFVPYQDLITNPKMWDCFLAEHPADSQDSQDRQAYRAAIEMVGTPYNYEGIWQVLTKTDTDNSEKRFCSEIAYEILTQYTRLPLPTMPSVEVTPRVLHQMLIDSLPRISLS
jgi:hypothetical protein